MTDERLVFGQPGEVSEDPVQPGVISGEQTKDMPEEIKPPLKVPPLSLYPQVKGKPYSVDYFDLGVNWEFSNYPQEIQTIEEFVGEEISKLGLENTIESYKEIISKVAAKVGLSENERTWHKLDKIVGYIKALKNIKKWEDKKLKIEGTYAETH